MPACVSSQRVLRAGRDQHRLVGLVQERKVGRQVEAAAHHHGERLGCAALGHALVAQLVVLGHPPVALLAYRARPHHHRIGLGAQVVEEPTVDLGGQPLGAPVERGLAVEARDHVEPEVGPVWRRQLVQAQPRRQLLRRGGPALGVDQLHARSLGQLLRRMQYPGNSKPRFGRQPRPARKIPPSEGCSAMNAFSTPSRSRR